MKICRVLATLAVAGVAISGCSKSQTTQARGNDEPDKKIETEAVRQETVRRAIEVVGTLAAEDQVNVSSQADGVVSRVLVDLGDRVKAGQVLLELDSREARVQPRPAEGGAGPRARTLRRHRPENRAADRTDARRQAEPPPSCARPSRRMTAPTSSTSGSWFRGRRSTMPTRRCAPSRPTYEAALQNAKNLTADIDASNAMRKLADAPAARRQHPRAVRRLRPEAPGVDRRIRQERSAGDEHRPGRSAEGDRRDSRADGALDRGESAGGPAGRRVPGQDVHRQGVAHQPGGQPADARVSVRGARPERRRPSSSRARSRACTSRRR